MSFESLGLAPFLLRALAEQGYETPTPIQQQAIPLLLRADGHCALQAQTGSGKTLAFLLPLLQRLTAEAGAGSSRARGGQADLGMRRPRAEF